MEISPQQLNRATLARQMLLERGSHPVPEAVRRIVAIQAQEAASPYVALWSRVTDFDPAELDQAFTAHSILKASLMRITLHAVHADDYPFFHRAMTPTLRASRLYDRRFAGAGMTVDEADRLLGPVIEFMSEPRTKADVDEMLISELGRDPGPWMWWAIRTFAPLIHAPGEPPWSFGRLNSYRASPVQLATDPDTAVRHLIRRYLEGFGPATRQDIGQFALLPQATIKPAIESMEGELETHTGPDGNALYDIVGGSIPTGDEVAPPRLLAMWDSILLAYKDRSRIIPEQYRRVIIRQNGDTLPTLLVDGTVCGVWRAGEHGIEALAFEPLSDASWDGLVSEAESLVRMLSTRERQVYGRYARWWPRIEGSWRELSNWE